MVLKIFDVAKKIATEITDEENVKELENLILNETLHQLQKKLDEKF